METYRDFRDHCGMNIKALKVRIDAIKKKRNDMIQNELSKTVGQLTRHLNKLEIERKTQKEWIRVYQSKINAALKQKIEENDLAIQEKKATPRNYKAKVKKSN